MMTSRDIVNAIAKKMIGTTYKDGYFIDVGNNIVCLTPTRVNMNTWNGYLKGDLTKELINISFLEGMNKEVPQVFLSENGTELFKVHEYCYITPSIEDKDILPIVKSIAQIKDGIYQDTTTKKVIDSGIIPSFPPLELVLFNKDNNKVVSGIYRNVSAANNAMRKMHNPNVEIRYRMLTNLKDELGNRNEFYMPLDTILPYITESKLNKNMKNKVIKLNENTLKQIVVESVKRVLNEDYFGRSISQGGSRYTDLYDIDNGENISKPGNKYAKKDATDFGEDGYGPKWDKNMYDLKAQTLGKGMDTLDYDKDWLENDPATKFDMAAQKHAMRDILKTNNSDFRNAGSAKAVAKLGIPMSIAYRLSNETLERIVKDLGGSFKPEYRQKIS